MASGGKGGTQTTTQKTELPQYVQDAQQNLINQGQTMTGPFTQTPGYAKAGFNADQLMAFDLARGMAQDAFTPQSSGMSFLDGVTASPSLLTGAAQAGPAAAAGAQQAGEQFKAGDAAQLGANEFQPFMNPYTSNVLDTTLNTMRREKNATAADIGARAAASGSFGGSREAVQRAQLDKNYGDQVSQTAANLMSQAFNNAQGLASNNAQMRQQTALQNTSLDNTLRFGQAATNAKLATDAALANAGAANQVNLTNAGYRQQAGLANQNAVNDIANQNAGRNLQAATVANTLDNNTYQRRAAALQQLLGIGNSQQEFAQGVIDAPWTMLDRLRSTTPSLNNTGGTTTTEAPDKTGTSLMQGGLGLLGMILSGL